MEKANRARDSARQEADEKYREDAKVYRKAVLSTKASTNVHFWARQAYWQPDEIVALSFGKDPRLVVWDDVKLHLPEWKFAREYEARREWVIRALQLGEFNKPCLPQHVTAWAARYSIPFPEDLLAEMDVARAPADAVIPSSAADPSLLAQELEAARAAIEELEKRLADEKLDANSRSSILRILLTVIQIAYACDLDDPASVDEVVSLIIKDAGGLYRNPDRKTLEKHVEAAFLRHQTDRENHEGKRPQPAKARAGIPKAK